MSKIIVDFSWLVYRSYYTFKTFTFINAENQLVYTGAIFGVLRQHIILKNAFPNYHFFYAVEPKKNLRYEIDPMYKLGRVKNKDTILKAFGLIEDIFSMLKLFPNTHIISADEGEGDDVMWSMAYYAPVDTQVYSADNDMLPLLDEGVKIFRQIKTGHIEYVGEDYIKNKFGVDVPPKSISLLKIIVGDSSDSIPCVYPRFPRPLLKRILDKCTNVYELMCFVDTDSKLAELKLRVEQLLKNEKLVKLRDVKVHEVEVGVRDVNYFVRNYGLKTLRKEFPDV